MMRTILCVAAVLSLASVAQAQQGRERQLSGAGLVLVNVAPVRAMGASAQQVAQQPPLVVNRGLVLRNDTPTPAVLLRPVTNQSDCANGQCSTAQAATGTAMRFAPRNDGEAETRPAPQPGTTEIDYARLSVEIANQLASDPRFRGPAGKDGLPGKDGVDGLPGKDGPTAAQVAELLRPQVVEEIRKQLTVKVRGE